jgi:uncharacterized membrane protein HdeD (DUF308 family)
VIILGLILLVIGFIAKIAIVWTIGIIVLVVGIILVVLGMAGSRRRRPETLLLAPGSRSARRSGSGTR